MPDQPAEPNAPGPDIAGPDTHAPDTPGPGARPGPEGPDDVALQRLRAALLRPSRAQLVVALLLAVLGFAAITQVRTNTTDNTYAGYREQDLVDVLSGLADTSQRAQTTINRLEASRRRLQQNRQDQAAALSAAQKQAEELSILAGLVPVTGPGIRLTVTEGPRPIDVNSVLDTIEELRSAGAEAMAVNGKVRLVAQSSVESAPGGLRIDGVLLTSPFVFDVIGDPHTLSGALNLVDGPMAQYRDAGAVPVVEQRDSLDITAVRKATP